MNNSRQRLVLFGAAALAIALVAPAFADQTNNPDDDDVAPAPPSIGADIPLTYFGPAPSQVQKELIGPYQLLKAGTVDLENGTVTLPLYKGKVREGPDTFHTVWYILTDTTDKGNAEALGLNYSPKLTYAEIDGAVRYAKLHHGAELVFARGMVDFEPERSVTGTGFPPTSFQPGSVADEHYSPLVLVSNAGRHVYNAPMIATGEDIEACDGDPDYTKVHDRVVRICPEEGTVTIEMTAGFSFARPIMYISMDSNDELAASLEAATWAPAMSQIDVGRDDSAWSAVERLFVMANGPTGSENPGRQGLDSAIQDHKSPLNVLGGIPTIATDYSPLWDLNLGFWTEEAKEKGYDFRVTEEFQILGLVEQGWITGPEGGPYGSTGIIVNCPIVFRFL
ncbi:hypothetical protein CENSYa_1696 [Cenarchaeum symbiosum A]|uniref:Uncharacterized protein n=1 Tax=Cenarchaeum symbiosum (strain A) TaxID=414004 RepID=A0RY95_CENSY|nr:hypothetical protein CENSYa_1696 [Cenarchaeum symbiosum A]